MLFKSFRGCAFAIQTAVLWAFLCTIPIVPWAYICYLNCSVGAHITFKIVPWACRTIQIVPWAYICYSNCSEGVPVQFKLYLCARLFYSNCSLGAPMYYSDCSVGLHMLFKLFFGRASVIPTVPLCVPIQIVP